MGLPDRHNHGSEVMVKREMSSETVNACTLKGRLSAIYEDGGSLQTSYFNECIKNQEPICSFACNDQALCPTNILYHRRY